MKNKNYIKNSERGLSTKRYALNSILGDPSKLEEARKLANYEKSEPAYKRAIVALGGPNQEKRLEKALYEYQSDPSAALIISGFGKDFQTKEKYMVKGKGLDSIVIDNKSTTTEENAINSIYNIEKEFPYVGRITIVSDYAHQPRAEMLFKGYARKSGRDYNIEFSGIKTEDKLHRVIYEIGAFPLSFMPYRIHKKLTQKIRSINYKG